MVMGMSSFVFLVRPGGDAARCLGPVIVACNYVFIVFYLVLHIWVDGGEG